ncbi:MAG: hypothetical protein ACLFNL_01180 [Bacteroidales bacterium]
MYNKIDIVDPHASPEELREEYEIDLANRKQGTYNPVIVAVSHEEFLAMEEKDFMKYVADETIFVDVKGLFKDKIKSLEYLSL